MAAIILHAGREKSLLRHHPWIFSGAVARLEGNAGLGETVDIYDSKGNFLAKAAYSPHSSIRARAWSWLDTAIDADFLKTKLDAAIKKRPLSDCLKITSRKGTPQHPAGCATRRTRHPSGMLREVHKVFLCGHKASLCAHCAFVVKTQELISRCLLSLNGLTGLTTATNAMRLVHAESDGIPGLIVDRYGDDLLVVQILTAGAEYWRETLADILVELTGIPNIYERSDVDVRALEGLPPRTGALRGNPPETVIIEEHGIKFTVDIANGHKTGFYLDQRENRHLVGQLAEGRDVLNCFCYTGGFSIHAAAGGAKSVVSIDASGEAIRLGVENTALNGQPGEIHEWLEGDVFKELRTFRDSRKSFDLIVLDPPKFAPTKKQVKRAARGYKDINLLAFKLLRPGGILVTFSCSGGIDMPLFQKIVADAALDAGVEAQFVQKLGQGADHPVALNFPEGEYLKGLVCRI